VYVALSPDPWNLRDWSRSSGWDYDRIGIDYNSQDPERDLTGLLEQIAGSRGFDYDLVEYYVHDVEIVRYEYNTPRYYAPGVWGTSLTEALRIYSDEMRDKRMSRAEEKAHALPVKLTLPLGLFIFPVMLVVIALPIIVRIRNTLF
jgi:hypothetical protein